jgi:hypothetical protein
MSNYFTNVGENAFRTEETHIRVRGSRGHEPEAMGVHNSLWTDSPEWPDPPPTRWRRVTPKNKKREREGAKILLSLSIKLIYDEKRVCVIFDYWDPDVPYGL